MLELENVEDHLVDCCAFGVIFEQKLDSVIFIVFRKLLVFVVDAGVDP